MRDIPLEDVRDRMVRALCNLYHYDADLLEVEANERSITHKLAEHIQQQFSGWHVDCEYNRRGDKPKRLNLNFGEIRPEDTVAKTVYPDIIIHRRNTNENLLVVEFKKKGECDVTHDGRKLQAFTADERYAYQHGLMLILGLEGCACAKLFQRGQEVDDWTSCFNNALEERINGE